MTLDPKSELENALDDLHICDDEGYGCEIENYYVDYDGKGERKYSRCKLRRESLDKFLSLYRSRHEIEKVLEPEEEPEAGNGFEGGFESAYRAKVRNRLRQELKLKLLGEDGGK